MGSWDIEGPPSQPLDSMMLLWLAIPKPSHKPPCSLPDICHTEFTVEPGRGWRWQKDVDKETKDVKETAFKSYNQNVPWSAAQEHSSTMAKCNEPAIN